MIRKLHMGEVKSIFHPWIVQCLTIKLDDSLVRCLDELSDTGIQVSWHCSETSESHAGMNNDESKNNHDIYYKFTTIYHSSIILFDKMAIRYQNFNANSDRVMLDSRQWVRT